MGLPTIILVQGSFQVPEVYGKLTAALEARGYPVIQPALPSLERPVEDGESAPKSLVDDASAVETVVRRLVEEENQPVVVAMHSYGGLVGIEAVSEDMSRQKRKTQGLPGGVVHLYFFAAFVLAEGQSVLGAFGESPNNDLRPDGRLGMKNAARILYNDLSPGEAEYWASRIIDQSYAVQTTELTRAAYRYIPSTYLVCSNDQGPPPQFQQMFGENAGSVMREIDSGHSPMLSRAEELASMIDEAARGAMEHAN